MLEYLYFIFNMLFSFIIYVKGVSDCYQIGMIVIIFDFFFYVVYDYNYLMIFCYIL